MTMTNICRICQEPVPPRYKYCARCSRHWSDFIETAAHILAMMAAWDPVAKGFRCYYTGVLLEQTDRSSPWYMTFDHRIPGRKGDLVLCAAWVNDMKTRLSEEEFRAVIMELDRHRITGEPFNMSVAKFEYWIGWAPRRPKRLAMLTSARLPKYGDCAICSARTWPYSLYCPTCRGIIRTFHNVTEHVTAMQASWDKARKAFICYLTGQALDPRDNTHPLFLTFEHAIPRTPGTLKLAAAFVNMMKSAFSEYEFWLLVGELARHFRTGEAFNSNIVKFAYWKGWALARKRRLLRH